MTIFFTASYSKAECMRVYSRLPSQPAPYPSPLQLTCFNLQFKHGSCLKKFAGRHAEVPSTVFSLQTLQWQLTPIAPLYTTSRQLSCACVFPGNAGNRVTCRLAVDRHLRGERGDFQIMTENGRIPNAQSFPFHVSALESQALKSQKLTMEMEIIVK